MTITVHKLDKLANKRFIRYDMQAFKFILAKSERERKHGAALLSTVGTFSGLTLTSMLVARLGMPSNIEDGGYTYDLEIPGMRGVFRIVFTKYKHERSTKLYVSKYLSAAARFMFISALLYDVIYRTLPNTTSVQQSVPCENEFEFSPFDAVANGDYNKFYVELDCTGHLSHEHGGANNDNKVCNTIQR